GEAFTFTNPLYEPRYHQTVLWSLSLRLPNGNRPPLADSYFNPFNGAALLTGFDVENPEIYIWDWQNNHTDPYHMTHGIDLIGHHLAYVSPAIEPSPPEWTTRFLPDAGHAVFRSDWSEDARWGLLVGEHGAARKTLHDHIDGTSFSIGAYGEYLLIDPGYYKPNILDNARTAHSQSHNVILINGKGAPDKGLLTDFGDADAWIKNTLDGHHVDYAEAHQTYEQTTIQRSMLLVRDRYFIIADRLQSDWLEPRTHTWRLHAGSGGDLGGVFALHSCEGDAGCGVTIEQERAGITVHIDTTEGDLIVEEPSFVEGYAPHVHQYDRTRSVGHHGVFDAKAEATAPNFLAVLAPYPTDGSIPALQVQPIDTPTGLSAWLIESEQGSDIVLLRDDDAPQQLYLPNGSSISTDAELLLMSLSDDAFTLIANGTNASIDGVYRSNIEFERAISLIENER
ncbi:MAG: heparinase II/III family protein, partial [Pseudomonadota bacterium]|nr:heparinase II/III family protein [Pseudomonadota bacterium]